jgi:hypothetical protein
LPGTKAAAGRRQDHGAKRDIRFDVSKDIGELPAHVGVDRVHHVGPVQGDRRQAIGLLEQERREIHSQIASPPIVIQG